jgi:hypothetical protein
MNDAQAAIMSELCVELGFCLTPERDWNWFAEQVVDSPEAFVRAVYLGEGLDPDGGERAGLKAAVREYGVRYLEAGQ